MRIRSGWPTLSLGLVTALLNWTALPANSFEEFSWSRFPAALQIRIQTKSREAQVTELKSAGTTSANETGEAYPYQRQQVRSHIYNALSQADIRESYLDEKGLAIVERCRPSGCKDLLVLIQGIHVNGRNDPDAAVAGITDASDTWGHAVFRVKTQGQDVKGANVRLVARNPMVVVTLLPIEEVGPYLQSLLRNTELTEILKQPTGPEEAQHQDQ